MSIDHDATVTYACKNAESLEAITKDLLQGCFPDHDGVADDLANYTMVSR